MKAGTATNLGLLGNLIKAYPVRNNRFIPLEITA